MIARRYRSARIVRQLAVLGGLADDKSEYARLVGRRRKSRRLRYDPRRHTAEDRFTKVRFEKGCESVCESDKDFAAAVDAAKARILRSLS
jgi:hypothetical protein